MGISGPRYRCLVCPEATVELCGECFDSCMHPHHPFAMRERPKGLWTVARCRATTEARPATEAHDGGGGGDGGGRSSAEAQAQLAAQLAELQSREITPEDYELLMALSSQAGAALALPSHPNTRGLIADARASSGGRGTSGAGAPSVASLASRLATYDEASVVPLVDEINEKEAQLAAERRAAKEAQERARAPPEMINGLSVPIMARSAGGEQGLSIGGQRVPMARGGFGSSAAYDEKMLEKYAKYYQKLRCSMQIPTS